MNVLLWISYKGTRYAGFQVQANGLTVCEVLQNAMQSVLGVRPDIKGCSRTDSGVHALRFALNFCYDGHVPVEKLVSAFNAYLPPDIRALRAEPAAEDFHARYAAHCKTYCYRIRNAAVDSPFEADTCHRVAGPLDLAAMRRTAAGFVGKHDFTALCAAGSSAAAHGDTVRTVTACRVESACCADMPDGQMLTILVTADGYLYNMVRILAGTILAAGQHKFDPAAVPALLAGKDRRAAGPTLPAKGLFLQDIQYT